MSYRSDVRIRLTKEDYNKLVKGYKEEILSKYNYSNLFDKDEFRTGLGVYKELKDCTIYDIKDGEYVDKFKECVYFGWNGLKWYDGYEDVEYIMNFIQDCKYYAFCRIGESSEGDIESFEEGMDPISYYYAFDDDEV